LGQVRDLTFSDIAKFGIRLFANFDGQRGLVERQPWLRGSRLALSVANVFDQRVPVHDANGLTPLSYQPARLDPVGRVIRLSFRKVL
jgi:iron complex outermembrane receptor protein